jgi:hypothetical protein
LADRFTKNRARALAFLAAAVAVTGAFVAYLAATDSQESTYFVKPTKSCFERTGHIVELHSSERGATGMYIDEKSLPFGKSGPYPNLTFFQSLSAARDYAEGDSTPLIRRGNVVLDYERYDASAESVPEVRVVIKCLRPKATG